MLLKLWLNNFKFVYNWNNVNFAEALLLLPLKLIEDLLSEGLSLSTESIVDIYKLGMLAKSWDWLIANFKEIKSFVYHFKLTKSENIVAKFFLYIYGLKLLVLGFSCLAFLIWWSLKMKWIRLDIYLVSQHSRWPTSNKIENMLEKIDFDEKQMFF